MDTTMVQEPTRVTHQITPQERLLILAMSSSPGESQNLLRWKGPIKSISQPCIGQPQEPHCMPETVIQILLELCQAMAVVTASRLPQPKQLSPCRLQQGWFAYKPLLPSNQGQGKKTRS